MAVAEPVSPELPEGARIARFRVVRLIGRGGMGAVYLAEDVEIHRKVALKTLSARFASDRDYLRRFDLEAEALGRIQNHPNVVVIYGKGKQDGIAYIAMELKNQGPPNTL